MFTERRLSSSFWRTTWSSNSRAVAATWRISSNARPLLSLTHAIPLVTPLTVPYGLTSQARQGIGKGPGRSLPNWPTSFETRIRLHGLLKEHAATFFAASIEIVARTAHLERWFARALVEAQPGSLDSPISEGECSRVKDRKGLAVLVDPAFKREAGRRRSWLSFESDPPGHCYEGGFVPDFGTEACVDHLVREDCKNSEIVDPLARVDGDEVFFTLA